jgi:hypothetical protein
METPALAGHVEASQSNCISESQIILHTRRSMPCWRIVFSTFRRCMSFHTWGNSGIGTLTRSASAASFCSAKSLLPQMMHTTGISGKTRPNWMATTRCSLDSTRCWIFALPKASSPTTTMLEITRFIWDANPSYDECRLRVNAHSKSYRERKERRRTLPLCSRLPAQTSWSCNWVIAPGWWFRCSPPLR